MFLHSREPVKVTKLKKKILVEVFINDEKEEPQNACTLPITKRKSALKKKALPEEYLIEPNLNRIIPMKGPKSLAEMTNEEKLQYNHFEIYRQNRLPKLKEDKPGLRGYRVDQIITKEWLKLKSNVQWLRLNK